MEQPKWKEMSAKTVEEAIEVALKELDADRTEVEIETLSPGKPGFLGIRSEPARVRVRKISEAQGAAGLAMGVVNKILAATGAHTVTTLKSAHDPDAGGPSIDITGEDSGLLIGRRGETLRALQFLVNLIIRNSLKEDAVRVVLDIERYKERRNNSLMDMALRVADKVAGTGRAVSLEPMSAAERRVVHMALAEHPRVSTESTGLGDSRKVVIAPKTQ
jgi:spoIIIJ-associated protein